MVTAASPVLTAIECSSFEHMPANVFDVSQEIPGTCIADQRARSLTVRRVKRTGHKPSGTCEKNLNAKARGYFVLLECLNTGCSVPVKKER